MTRIKRFLVGVAAVLAASAMMVSTASAAHEFLENGTPVTAQLQVTSVAGPWTFEQSSLKLKCETALISGWIGPGGMSLADFVFEHNCAVEVPEHCAVAEPILMLALDQLGLVAGLNLLDNFTPDGKGNLTLFHFSNNGGTCPLGETEVTGSFFTLLGTPVEYEANTVEHTLTFNAEGSKNLFTEGSPATFKLKVKVKLVNGGQWSIK
jgi:hypothetical protein